MAKKKKPAPKTKTYHTPKPKDVPVDDIFIVEGNMEEKKLIQWLLKGASTDYTRPVLKEVKEAAQRVRDLTDPE